MNVEPFKIHPRLAKPVAMNMGCHYNPMYSRRTRIKVLGLVEQSSEAWTEWYLALHEREALREMAEAGYGLTEIHFTYGYGWEGEKEDIELTRKFVKHAHEVGIMVLGYFQFFSVQRELFFLENPWAKDCLQRDWKGAVRLYAYDRPALCFSHPRVRQYYREGIERGLTYCDLDGFRFDNDYYRGCYCDTCQQEFKQYLRETYAPDLAKKVFGLPTLEGVSLFPWNNMKFPVRGADPLWGATGRFRQAQRQAFLKELSDHMRKIKPDTIFGSNPCAARGLPESTRIHVYPPDLGETHDLVCAENQCFPARVGEGIRHQLLSYKSGQSGGYKVYASHHIPDSKPGHVRWPATQEECALSLCEGLCFGGHIPGTTWGLRMDENGETLYKRPYFLAALTPVAEFLKAHGESYLDATCDAQVGLYMNREALISDEELCAPARDVVIQILLQNQVPFRFVDRDTDAALEGLKVLIVPDVRLVSDEQLVRLATFAADQGVIWSGGSALYDEFFLPRKTSDLQALYEARGTRRINSFDLPDTEGEDDSGEEWGSRFGVDAFERPTEKDALSHAAGLLQAIRELIELPVKVSGSPYLGVDTFRHEGTRRTVHLLNYDNDQPVDATVQLRQVKGPIEVLSPEGLGCASEPIVTQAEGVTTVQCKGLQTYAFLSFNVEEE